MDIRSKKRHLSPMVKVHTTTDRTQDRRKRAPDSARAAIPTAEFRKAPRVRVVPHEGMTDAQKRIADAAERPGKPVPVELSDEELLAYLANKCR